MMSRRWLLQGTPTSRAGNLDTAKELDNSILARLDALDEALQELRDIINHDKF